MSEPTDRSPWRSRCRRRLRVLRRPLLAWAIAATLMLSLAPVGMLASGGVADAHVKRTPSIPSVLQSYEETHDIDYDHVWYRVAVGPMGWWKYRAATKIACTPGRVFASGHGHLKPCDGVPIRAFGWSKGDGAPFRTREARSAPRVARVSGSCRPSRAELFILNRESSNTASVWNRSGSSAYGLGQLTAGNRARHGGNPGSSYCEQLSAFRKYVAARYGSIHAAAAFHRSHGWY